MCKHGIPASRCGHCIPKYKWPREFKRCRCGWLIPQDWLTCRRCHDHEEAIWADEDRHQLRRTMRAVIVQLNH